MIFLFCFLALFLSLAIITLKDYGPGFDQGEYYLGDKYYAFLTSLDRSYLDFKADNIDLYERPDHPNFYIFSSFQAYNPHHVWPVGITCCSLTKDIFFTRLGLMGAIDAHHLALPLFVATLCVLLFVFLYRAANIYVAMGSILILVCYPRFWAHLHFNPKDVPNCLSFSLVILLFYISLRKNSWKLMILAAVSWGFALATKGNAYFLPFILGPFFLYYLWFSSRHLNQKLLQRGMMISLCSFPFIGMMVMIMLWPLMWINFPEQLVNHFTFVLQRGRSNDPHWNASPVIYAFSTMPTSFLVLWVTGWVGIARDCLRKRQLKPLYLIFALWTVLPVLRVSVPYSFDYDGIRHWIEFVVIASIIAGYGFSFLVQIAFKLTERNRQGHQKAAFRHCLALLLCVPFVLPVVSWNIRNHPNQVVHFNALLGGLKAAQAMELPEATDYWGISYRQSMRWLNENVPQSSIVIPGPAMDVFSMNAKVWLRPDIRIMNLLTAKGTGDLHQKMRDALDDCNESVYVVYITRRDHYWNPLRQWDEKMIPIHEIKVDGGVILKVLQIKGNGNYTVDRAIIAQ